MDQLIGTTMGPYTITEWIGEGGMAIVYKGYQESLHRYVALKVLRDELARDQQFVARFRQEALAAANLNHPNIVHVYDAGAANGKYFISMAYVEGGTLKDLIRQGAIQPEGAVSITIQLAEALDHAHKQGLIHRDVKPSNVLMTQDGRPLLTDFGIAKALFEAKQLTRTGASIGTPEYMAPEQAQGKTPDGRTDIYALGVVLYEMLASKVPFCTDTPVATMYMHVHEPPPPLSQVEGTVPGWLENIVCKALAKDPADRYATAALFAAALRQGQESWAAAARPVTGAAAVAATPADTEAVTMVEPGVAAAATAATAAAVAGAVTTPLENEAVTMAAAGAAGAARASTTPAPATGTPVPAAGKKRRKALVPILVAAIALLVVATAASAAVLLIGGGTPTPTEYVTVVITSEDQPAEEVDDAGGEAIATTPDTPTATEGVTGTPTTTSTPTMTPSGTATSTPSPSATASGTPTRTPTATKTATSTLTIVPTDTPVTPTNTPVPPPPPPPEDTDTPVPPPPPPPEDTDTPVPPPPPPTEKPTEPPPPPP